MNENNPHLMGTEPIGKLLLQYSIPAIIGMTIVSLYNIIDSIFIGHGVGSMAIAGLAITFPMMNLTAAFGNLVSAGGATVSSIRLGQKDTEGVNKVLGNTLMLCIVNSVVFGGLSLIFLDDILRFFGASNETLPYARDFMQVILAGTPFAYVMIGMNYVMRATGHPKKAMLTSMASVLCNVILAPLFIFQFGWGIRGAALATIISQFIGMLWVLNHFLNKHNDIRLQRRFLHLERRIVGDIFSIGMSPFLMNVTACVIVIIINNALRNHGGDMAIGSYGIINRLLMLYLMITLRLAITWGVCITTSGFLICELLPHAVSAVFTSDDVLIDMAAHGLRICVAMFPVIGAQIVIGNFFQNIGLAKMSLFLSLTRQLIFLLPCLLFFPGIWGLDGVWASLPVSDLLAFLTAVAALWWYMRKQKRKEAAIVS